MKELKFSIPRTELLTALTSLVNVTPVRTSLAALEYVNFSLEKKTLALSSTDMDIFVTHNIDVSSKDTGEFMLNGKLLLSTISLLSGEEVSFTVKGEQVLISSGTNTTKMRYLTVGLPVLNGFEPSMAFDMVSTILSESLLTVIPSINTTDSSTAIDGCLFSIKDKQITFVGTNGKICSAISQPVKCKTDIDIVLPRKTVGLLSKLFTEGNVKIELSATMVRFSNDTLSFSCKTTGLEFPNWAGLQAKEIKTKTSLNRKQFIDSVKRVTSLGFTDKLSGNFKITLSRDNLNLYCYNEITLSESEEDLIVDYKGEEFSVGFNGNFMLSLLTSLEIDTIELLMPEGKGLPQINAVGMDNGKFFIAPYRFN
jgi:DNA polymerase III, beta subunit